MKKRIARSIGGLIGVASAAVILASNTAPVAAAPTNALPTVAPPGISASWTWRAAGREAVTGGVSGAIAGAGGTAVFGTPAATVGGAVGGAFGAVGGFATYAGGQAYDAVFGGNCLNVRDPGDGPICEIAPPDTALD